MHLSIKIIALLTLNIVCSSLTALSADTLLKFEMPARNPYLADSNNAMAHGDSAQQDAVLQPGPMGPSRILSTSELQYNFSGPGLMGILTSGEYVDGQRVFWGNGLDRLVKLDYQSYQTITEFYLPNVEPYTESQAEKSIVGFDKSNSGLLAVIRGFMEIWKLKNLSGLYTVLDKDHNYYVGNKSGLIQVYGDQNPMNSRSPIIKLRQWQLPDEVTGPIVGINLTYDGRLIVATEHGYLVAVKRDFSEYQRVRIRHSEGAENKATQRAGYGWVRNGFAIDQEGGIYIASQEHIHKVVWTGEKLSTDISDGAWTEPYLNQWKHGTGATPSLMGFGEEDQFVVITDGQPQMNLVLFWRNAIPDNWQQLSNTSSRRVAGQLPVNMGKTQAFEIQTEQSVVVAGYGALVVNNNANNKPWYLPKQAVSVLQSYLGSHPDHQPYGAQKFKWDPVSRQLREDWVNPSISSPSAVPIVGIGSNMAYLIGARNNQWTLEGLDWDTGVSKFHYVIGGQRYNPLYSATLIDNDGNIHYGTPWGRVRLIPAQEISDD
ncbi:hypothetical protein [uncultured Microbulbifer sp.]|uniref:hypothetical protein n=1 Tax=uncultured Microbulbifer sp. TaxID=348147 RepID=UPI00261541DF|nr:hypothetical protein [uncultured Microbulbifer sp.]